MFKSDFSNHTVTEEKKNKTYFLSKDIVKQKI